MLSIILVNYNERDHLVRVVKKLPDELVDVPHEILIVDNASTDGSPEAVRQQFPNAQLLEPKQNLFYGRGNNYGMERAKGAWMLILNPDVDWEPGQLRKFIQDVQSRDRIAMAGPKIMGVDQRLQRSSHHHFPSGWTVFVDYCLPLQQLFLRLPWHPALYSSAMHQTVHQTAHLTGVCLLFPRKTYEATQGFDPAFSMYLEETEWQQRMSKDQERWYFGSSQLTHFGSTEKRFAQSSRHYLWGLWHYAGKHWRGAIPQLRLLVLLWLAALLSLVLLLVFWIPSVFLGRIGKRIRHYTREYVRLIGQLAAYPTTSPT